MFGGKTGTFLRTNALWKLSRNNDGCFRWSRIQIVNSQLPSPRSNQSGWEYENKLWVFGGYGPQPLGNHLNDHGTFTINFSDADGINNQLLCYDPCSQTWTNPECSGYVPFPCSYYAAAIVRVQVWLCAEGAGVGFSDIYKLDMRSLAWTHITSSFPGHQDVLNNTSVSLSAITDTQLVLLTYSNGCYIDAWMLNTENMTQSRIDKPFHQSQKRCNYTAIAGINSSTIIIGGRPHPLARPPSTLSVMLEQKSLQQLAAQMIYEHRTDNYWKSLPKKLIYKIMASKNDKDTQDVYTCEIMDNQPQLPDKGT